MIDELIDSVEGHIKQMPNGGKSRFAAKAGISHKTLARFLDGEPTSPKTVMAILEAVHGNNIGKVLKTLSSKYPEDNDIEKMSQIYKEKGANSADPSIKDFARRSLFSYMMNVLLSRDEGTSRTEIHNALGSAGLEFLDELRENDMIVEMDGDRFRFHETRHGFGDGETARIFNSFLFGLYDPKTYATKDSHIGHLYGWINEEGLSEIKDVLLGAVLKCAQIEQKYSSGPERLKCTIPFAIGTGMVKICDVQPKNNSEALS